MASGSVPGMHIWDNQYYSWLPGALGLSPGYEGGVRALFLLRHGVVERSSYGRCLYAVAGVLRMGAFILTSMGLRDKQPSRSTRRNEPQRAPSR